MAINIQNTNTVSSDGAKILVYGESGAGKTTLIKTLPRPFVISAEKGLLSIKGSGIDYCSVSSLEEVGEAYEYLSTSDAREKYDSIALDSVSEIAETVLSNEKRRSKDPRQAYGEMQDKMAQLIRMFRDIPGKNVLFTAKLDKSQDELGRIMYAPSMPGKSLAMQLPYFFDEVFALRVEKDGDGNKIRVLQTDSDGLWNAKDRSGSLDMWEGAPSPDLGELIKKIGG